jgi:hypothetical protein
MVHTQLSHLLVLPLKDRLWIKKLLIIIVACTYTRLICLCSRIRNPLEGFTTLKPYGGGWQSLNEQGQELEKPLTKPKRFLKNIPLKGRCVIRCKLVLDNAFCTYEHAQAWFTSVNKMIF